MRLPYSPVSGDLALEIKFLHEGHSTSLFSTWSIQLHCEKIEWIITKTFYYFERDEGTKICEHYNNIKRTMGGNFTGAPDQIIRIKK